MAFFVFSFSQSKSDDRVLFWSEALKSSFEVAFRKLRACRACEAIFFSRINFICRDGKLILLVQVAKLSSEVVGTFSRTANFFFMEQFYLPR